MIQYNKIIAVFLVFCLSICLLAGCGSEPSGENAALTGTSASQITSAPQADPISIPAIPAQNVLQEGDPRTLEEWLFTNYQQSFSWKDHLGNICYASVTLPALTPVSEFAVSFNNEMEALGIRILDDIGSAMEDGYGSSVLSANYQAWLNDEILSVLLTIHLSDGSLDYRVYNFDVEDREAIRTADICDEVLELDYPTFLLATNRIVSQNFEKQYGSLVPTEDAALLDEEKKNLIQNYNGILSEIGLNTVQIISRQLFLCENGQVLLLYNAPTLTADGIAGYAPTILEFNPDAANWEQPPTEAQAYHELFYLTYEVDGAYADAYAEILRQAFFADNSDFIQYAAMETDTCQNSITFLLTYGISDESRQEMHKELHEIMEDIDTSSAGKTLSDRILKLLYE